MSDDEKQESHSLSSQELIVLDETTPPVIEEHSVDLPDDEVRRLHEYIYYRHGDYHA